MISGNTIKKLNIPTYKPILFEGRTELNMAYGIDKILVQAIPTPVMLAKSKYLSFINATDMRPIAPISKQIVCVFLLPILLAIDGNMNENKKVIIL